MTPAKIEAARTLMQQGTPAKDVAATLGVSVPTLYRWVPAGGMESRMDASAATVAA
jgi:transposase-like protein